MSTALFTVGILLIFISRIARPCARFLDELCTLLRI